MPVVGHKKMIKQRNRNQHQKQLISPADFFSCKKEKTKLNWFCFEFALEFQNFIYRDLKLKSQLKRKKIDDEAIAKFCIHYAKHMKKPILDKITGLSENLTLSYLEIENYFPSIDDCLVDRLLTIAGKAWDSQTELCMCCPTRCISERDKIAPMFDDPFYCE